MEIALQYKLLDAAEKKEYFKTLWTALMQTQSLSY